MPIRGEAVLLRGLQLQTIIAVVAGQAAPSALEPEMLESCGPMVFAADAEGVDVILTDIAPVLETDAQLERSLGRGHERLLIDVQQSVERHQRRNGRLAHTDGGNFVRLDQGDVEVLAQRLGQRGGRHPACSSATGDDDAPDRFGDSAGGICMIHVANPFIDSVASTVAPAMSARHRQSSAKARRVRSAQYAPQWFHRPRKHSGGTSPAMRNAALPADRERT
jgi:hypothetical protein